MCKPSYISIYTHTRACRSYVNIHIHTYIHICSCVHIICVCVVVHVSLCCPCSRSGLIPGAQDLGGGAPRNTRGTARRRAQHRQGAAPEPRCCHNSCYDYFCYYTITIVRVTVNTIVCPVIIVIALAVTVTVIVMAQERAQVL